MNLWKQLIRCLVFALALAAVTSAIAQKPNLSALSAGLSERLEKQPEGYHSIYLLLADRVDVATLEQELKAQKAPLQERAYQIITSLQNKAEATQPAFIAELEKMEGVRPASMQGFWITNAIFLEADYNAITALSRHPAVEAIDYNWPLEILDTQNEAAPAPVLMDNTEPGLAAIGAPELWAMGYSGYGHKALIIDTGQDPEHPALFNQFAYHNRPLNQSWSSPEALGYCDSHGTNVASCVVGLDRITRDTLGAAFDGQWMGGPIVLNLTTGGNCQYEGTVLSSFQTMQWALNPDGNNATTEDMPDVINNSWGGEATASDCFDVAQRNLYDALLGAGIAVVYAAGNQGPGASTISRPGVLNYGLVRIFTVGNLDGNNPNYPINVSSSRGPSICSGNGPLAIKPEVSAPGTQVRLASPGNDYIVADGTSFAAPYVSGAILLLKEAFPFLSGEEIMLALYFTCTDLGEVGEDNVFGMGIINIPAAFQYLVEQGHTPVPPVTAPNDIVLLRIETLEFNCSEAIAPLILVENDGTDIVQSMVIRMKLEGSTNPTVDYNWEGVLAPKERVEIQLPALPVPAGEQVLIVDVIQANGQPDARSLNNRLKKEVKVVSEEPVPTVVAGEAPVCQNGNALLMSLYEGPARVRWYDAEESGTLLGEGNPFLLESVSSSQTVYARVSPTAKVGKADFSGSAQLGDAEQGLIFDAGTNFFLRSVRVYAEESGGRLIRLIRSDGSTVNKIVQLQAGDQRVQLDLSIQPGNNQRLVLGVGKPLRFTLGSVNFPYEVPNVVTIRRSTNSSAFYQYFFDWEIEYDYFCGLTAVEVDVTSAASAALAAFTPLDTVLDLASGFNEITFTSQSPDAASWFWDFGDGTTSTGQNPSHAYVDTGLYQVSLTVVGQEGCSSSAIGNVQVIEGLVNSPEVATPENEFELFPNPAQDQLFLSFQNPLPSGAVIAMTDVLGRVVLFRQLEPYPDSAVELSVAHTPAGVYWLVVQADGQRMARKVVIAR